MMRRGKSVSSNGVGGNVYSGGIHLLVDGITFRNFWNGIYRWYINLIYLIIEWVRGGKWEYKLAKYVTFHGLYFS
jgi:hypothetical protein